MIRSIDIETMLYRWSPRDTAESWDNVGLLVGNPQQEVRRILVALDVVPKVVQEAIDGGYDTIVAHHPVMNCRWQPVQTLREDSLQGRLLRCLIRHDLSVICMHTNLDAAAGGVNDLLAQRLGLSAREILDESSGMGRVGNLERTLNHAEFLQRVKERLSPNGLRYVEGTQPICRVAVGGGSCGDFLHLAVERGCQAFVTADVKYNQFLTAKEQGILLVDAGHFPTEDVVCPEIVLRLREAFPTISVEKSTSHQEVIQYL